MARWFPMMTKTHGRLAGLLYLIPTLLGPFSMMYVPSVVVVPGNAAATAERLIASESLFRLGLLSDSAIFLSEIGLSAILYVLLRPVGKTLAITAAFARLAMAVVQAVNLLPHVAALQLSAGARAAVEPAQMQALALLMLELHGVGVHVWEIFFALHCLTVGVLVFRSGFFPRALGILLAIASVGYALDGIGNLVAPRGAAVYEVLVAAGAIVGELPFVFCLLFKRMRTP